MYVPIIIYSFYHLQNKYHTTNKSSTYRISVKINRCNNVYFGWLEKRLYYHPHTDTDTLNITGSIKGFLIYNITYLSQSRVLVLNELHLTVTSWYRNVQKIDEHSNRPRCSWLQ